MFKAIPIDKKVKPLKIGVIGEIYLTIESYVNHDVEEMLGDLGCELTRKIRMSTFIEHGIDPLHKKKMRKKAAGYLGTYVGGHGWESVGDMLDFGQKGYDGVVHLAPFGCMPETTVRPILTRVSKEYKLPLLSLTYDEQSSKAGIQTRVEAFIDMVRKSVRKKRERRGPG
jgi:predicted nucleotide-binding protein (sugar kinase/HSP70/actin superfamily)